MKLLGLLVAAFSFVALGFGLTLHLSSFYLLFGFGIICAITTFLSGGISSYLKIFAAIFSTEYLVFGLVAIAPRLGLLRSLPPDFHMPVTVPLTVALFSIATFAVSYIPLVKRMLVIADRYYETRNRSRARIWPFPAFAADERTIAIAMIVFLVLINQVQVLLNLRLSFFGRDFVNALNAKDSVEFWKQLLVVFPILAFPYIASQVFEFVVQSTLMIRWRAWLTNYYAGRWLNQHAHYRISLSGQIADNPDQRISEDVIRFIDGYGTPNGLGIYTISITLIAKFSNLVSFAILLWTLSAGFTWPGTTFAVPGFLFWCALAYAALGTVLTHLLGRKLRFLSFTRQRFEADFRFSMARMREYGEQIALLRGESTERASLDRRFDAIVGNYFQIVSVRKTMMVFTGFYGQVNPFIPYIVSAPFYFVGKITFGVLNQIAGAFSAVSDALTFFVDYYVSLAEFQSVVDRLTSFDGALGKAEQQIVALPDPSPSSAAGHQLALRDLTLRLPNGREVLSNIDLTFAGKQHVMLTGPSGSGKSTLFRAIAGIWPYATGSVTRPSDATLMVLPQKPYFPIGTLRSAATYPSETGAYPTDTIEAALRAVKLDALVEQLDVEDVWSQRLSGGEQQRFAIARAILARPDWLLLDEATSAMDLELEAHIFDKLVEMLPETTILSIAHQASLSDRYGRRLDMRDLGAKAKPALEVV